LYLFLFSASEASSSVSGVSSASSTVKKVEVTKKDITGAAVATSTVTKESDTAKKSVEENGDDELAAAGGVEGEDTMKNLRKTFAGIFGDIKQ
jgi:hypothetical protein